MRPIPMLRCVTLLLAMLLLSACSRAAVASSATATPLPTPTPFPIPTMPPMPTVAVIQSSGQTVWGNIAFWTHTNLPAGFGQQFHVSDLQVAESDGKTAYACAVPGDQTQSGHPRVVVTHNGGASWAYATDIPASWGSCARLVVDMLDPSLVIAQEDFLGPQEITFNGGRAWQALLLPPQEEISQFATHGDHAYALILIPQNGGSSSSEILAESSDRLHTWQEIDANLAAMNLRNFWINPGSGALLLQTYANGLWTSTNDGATWEQMNIPASNIVGYMVQQPIANQPWRLCAEYYASQDASTGSLICTADGGKAWYMPPAAPFLQMAGITSDGALLVYDRSFMVYRLPAGATRWQKLGAAPHKGGSILYMPASAGGMLWMFAMESDGAGAPPDPRAIYSARYPY